MGTRGVGMSKGAIVAALLMVSAQVARGFSPSRLPAGARGDGVAEVLLQSLELS